MDKKNILIAIIAAGIVGIFAGTFIAPILNPHNMSNMSTEDMGTDEKRDHFIELKEDIQGDMMPQGKYRCCLENPCVYCIEKTPGHGEGAICDCLSDLMNGVHPCGECIGEILEGHGNPYLSEYFARAIAEKVGEHHIGTLRQMISEKYDIAVEDQL